MKLKIYTAIITVLILGMIPVLGILVFDYNSARYDFAGIIIVGVVFLIVIGLFLIIPFLIAGTVYNILKDIFGDS